MKNRLLLPCMIIIAFLCASALPVHFMSSRTQTPSCETSETTDTAVTQKQTVQQQKTENESEYDGISDSDALINCIAMVDPDCFSSPGKADVNQLFKIAFWCVLRSDKIGNYDFSLKQMTVSRKQTEKMYNSLFPKAEIPKACDVDFNGVLFTYDKTDNCYRVPVTGITSDYTGKIVKKNEKENKLIFETQYIPHSKWTQDGKGTIIPPKAEKTMLITLKKNSNGSFRVCSVEKK